MAKLNSNHFLAVVPLLPVVYLSICLLDNPLTILAKSIEHSQPEILPVGSQLVAYATMAVLGFVATQRLVPHIQQYTLRKGISGRDLGKRGTAAADKEM